MAYIFLAAAAIVWGGAFVVGRLLVSDVDPLAVAWLRFLIASAVFALMAGGSRLIGRHRTRSVAPEHPAPDRATDGASTDPPPGASKAASAGTGPRGRPGWPAYALLGLSGVFAYNCFFFYGLTRTGASESSLIIASSPVVVALLSTVFLGESLSARKVGGIALSAAGVALVVLGAASAGAVTGEAGEAAAAAVAGEGRLTGDLLMLGAVVSWAVYSLVGKRVLAHVSSFTATSRAVWWGTLFFTVPVAVKYGAGVFTLFGWREILGLLYLGLVCTVFGFVSWYRGLSGTEVSRAAVFLNLVPVSTLTIAAVTLGERPTWLQLLGGLMVLGGVWTVTVRAANGSAGQPKQPGQARAASGGTASGRVRGDRGFFFRKTTPRGRSRPLPGR